MNKAVSNISVHLFWSNDRHALCLLHCNLNICKWIWQCSGFTTTFRTSQTSVYLIPQEIDKKALFFCVQRNIRNYLGVVGVGRLVYYSSAFIIDVIEFLLPAVILIVLCAVSQVLVVNTCWSAPAGQHLLVNTYWPTPAGQHLLASTCWSTLAGQRLLVNACWSALAGQHLLVSICWSTLAGQHLLVNACWSTLAGQHLLANTALAGQHLLISTALAGQHFAGQRSTCWSTLAGQHSICCSTIALAGQHLLGGFSVLTVNWLRAWVDESFIEWIGQDCWSQRKPVKKRHKNG